jgi:H+/gluconate symporter-like permease
VKVIKLGLGIGVAALLAVSVPSCGLLSGSQPAPPAPVIVTNNIPSGSDSGIMVLLTVAAGLAFLLAVGLVVAGMLWHNERKRRQSAEEVVRQMIPRVNPEALSLAMAPPASVDRLQGFLVPEQRKQLR